MNKHLQLTFACVIVALLVGIYWEAGEPRRAAERARVEAAQWQEIRTRAELQATQQELAAAAQKRAKEEEQEARSREATRKQQQAERAQAEADKRENDRIVNEARKKMCEQQPFLTDCKKNPPK